MAIAAAPLPPDKAFQFSAAAKDNQTLLLSWNIAPHYYLYQSRFTFQPIQSSGITLGSPIYPSDTQILKTIAGHEAVYANHVTIPIPLVRSHQKHVILQVKYQGCSKAGYCYPPISKAVSIDLTGPYLQPVYGFNLDAAPQPITQTSETPLQKNPFFLLLSFLGFGILLSLTPCVLPMIPILFKMIAGHQKSHSHAFVISCSYVIGMSTMYACAGILFGIIGKNIQMIFQKPSVIIAFSVLFILMALSEFGLFNLQPPEKWRKKIDRLSHHQKRGSIIGAFIVGSLSTLILSPCVTPPLVAALTLISHTGNAALGGTALFVMGIGMGVPLLLIGIAGPKILPKSGKWMNAVKIFTGILLLTVAVLMLQRLLPNDISKNLHFQSVQNISQVEQALIQKKPKQQVVLLDFYADWCIACKEMDETTLKDPVIIARLAKYVLLQANVTKNTVDNQLLMQHFKIIGTPTILFFRDQKELPNTRIVGYITSRKFLKRLDHVDKMN